MTLPIITERLILRRYNYDDVQYILEFVSHPSVSRVTTGIEATEAGITRYIELQNSYESFERDKCFDLAIELKKDSKVIGLLSLVHKDHRQGQIGWALGIRYRGRGYATEGAGALIRYGFKELGLHRIYAETTGGNPSSLKVMERIGMRQEARLRQAELRDDKWLDVYIYGLLAGELKDLN